MCPPTSDSGSPVPNTYVDIDVDVWSQACQGIHVNVMVTELWGGGPSGCASGGGSSRGGGRSCKWNKVSCWSQNARLIKITRKKADQHKQKNFTKQKTRSADKTKHSETLLRFSHKR